MSNPPEKENFVKENNLNDIVNNNEKKEQKKQKHVTFSKPAYTIIDVESYKKYNEDISETRFYYVEERKSNDYARANCSCNIF
jgi:hypothetical protein